MKILSINMQPTAGDDIAQCAGEAIYFAKKHDCMVFFTFNGINLFADGWMKVRTIVESYKRTDAAVQRQETVAPDRELAH